MGRPAIDMTGMVFDRLTVLHRAPYVVGRSAEWMCQCMCGEVCRVQRGHLLSGETRSCGCFRRDCITTHGCSDTRLYRTWGGMLDRCNNENSTFYYEYGERGIEVCKEWCEFESFMEWAFESGYDANLEIDRKDNNLGYFPDNCRWVDGFTQAYNKRMYRSNSSGVIGVNWVERDNKWQARISVNGERISLGSFHNFEDAVEARKEAELKYYGELKNA